MADLAGSSPGRIAVPAKPSPEKLLVKTSEVLEDQPPETRTRIRGFDRFGWNGELKLGYCDNDPVGYLDRLRLAKVATDEWSNLTTFGKVLLTANGERGLSNAYDAFNRMLQDGQAADKNGLSKASRTTVTEWVACFHASTGKAAAKNAQGQKVLE